MASANLIVIFIAIVILALFLIIRFNVNSLFVLTGALFLFGLLSGTALQDITTAFRSGFGSTAG
ncbi:MAG TPA: GntP family permease, partial [Spirochaetota bacterium]|nr:GntP family permease [Spirochaetota bacterium]